MRSSDLLERVVRYWAVIEGRTQGIIRCPPPGVVVNAVEAIAMRTNHESRLPPLRNDVHHWRKWSRRRRC